MGNLCGGAKNAPTATQNTKQDAGKLLRENPKTTAQTPKALENQVKPTPIAPTKATVAAKPVEVAAPPKVEKKE